MKNIVLSFDDSRGDFYTNVFTLLKKYQVPATLNVVTDFIENPEHYHFISAGNKAMTIAQVQECAQSGLVEIASHGHTHKNTGQDILDSIAVLEQWGGVINGKIGFASPGSKTFYANRSDKGVWQLVQQGTLSYVRTGINSRREGKVFAALRGLDSMIHSKHLFCYLNKRTIINHPKEPFLLSTTIHSYTRLRQIAYFIEKMPDGAAAILMFHSVLKKGEAGYGADQFYYNYDQFEDLLKSLSTNNSVRVLTTMEYVSEHFAEKNK